MICLPQADAGGQVAAVVGAASCSCGLAAGVATGAIVEGVGGIVVERCAHVEPIVCTSLQKAGHRNMLSC